MEVHILIQFNMNIFSSVKQLIRLTVDCGELNVKDISLPFKLTVLLNSSTSFTRNLLISTGP